MRQNKKIALGNLGGCQLAKNRILELKQIGFDIA